MCWCKGAGGKVVSAEGAGVRVFCCSVSVGVRVLCCSVSVGVRVLCLPLL